MSRPKIRLLLAEPYPIALRGICCIAETKDYYQVVGETQDGRDGLQLAIDIEPDIAIVAYALPGLNGIRLAHEVRRFCPKIEILLYTMYDREEIIEGAVGAGIHGIVLKSDPASEMLAALDALSVCRPYFSRSLPSNLVERIANKRSPSILTSREREVVQLVSQGLTTKEAANVLGLSTKTIETYRSSVRYKLEIRTTADLVRYAARNNLILC